MTNDYILPDDAFEDISESGYTEADYPVIGGLVTVASRMIDAHLGRWPGFFYPTTDEQVFYYDGSDCAEQRINEFVSISQVSIAEQGGLSSTDYTNWTLNTDYLTFPYNAAALRKPINKLLIANHVGTKGAFYGFQRSVRVTGIPGYSATPPDLVLQACKAQSIQWFMKAKMGYQTMGSGETKPALNYALDDNVQTMLYPLLLELS
jgi:hypothetical protein